ncbi:MAG: SulP family inorganic anion transporter, partial [Chloroflexota bacterium]
MSNALAGVLVGIIAFPLAIALAVAVGVSPVAGLYTAAFAGFAASLFGGSRFNITGPTAALVPLLLHVTVRHGVEALPLVGFLAGLMLVAMGLLKFGRLVRFMPGLVVVGFTGGIAISIALGQLNTLLGLRGTDARLEYAHEKLIDSVRHLGTVEPASAIIGVLAIAFLFLW